MLGLPAALAQSAALMGGARQAVQNARKNEAMRELLRTAGWQWTGWMLLGLALLKASRSALRPAAGAAIALGLWTVAAWVSRVPWPFAGRAFEPARGEVEPWSMPAPFVFVLGGIALAGWMLATVRPRSGAAPAPQAPGSRIGYPGLVVATGLGWLLLLDLSAEGHLANRYLALYHQGHLWLGMLGLSLLLFLRQPLARGLAWTLSISGELARRMRMRFGSWRALAALALGSLAALAVFGLALSNMRQLTSELGRLWLIVGAAWFFFLRGGPLAERLSRDGGAALSALRYIWPLLFVVSVLIAAMLVTHDMGPLLIACYASGAFLAASVAMWWHQRSGRSAGALFIAVALFTLWIAATTLALFKAGAIDSVTAARLESLAAPLASTNDQLALVAWFQQAAPRGGFGIGAVPWCGYAGGAGCGGVPAQIHSDYTFTAMVGVFGATAAWAAAIGCAIWLHRLIRHHGRVTHGEPRFVRSGGRWTHDAQAFLSWVAVAWVVLTLCQLAVTVAGNLAVLPLTGVTFPFVSFGMTSLVVNMGVLALALNVDLPQQGEGHG
jgi:cell division protein FtsW (lipid II flippase)